MLILHIFYVDNKILQLFLFRITGHKLINTPISLFRSLMAKLWKTGGGHMVLASRASGCLFGHPNP